MKSAPEKLKKSSAFKALFFGGLLPVIAFSVIEEFYGPVWGTFAGMTFGIGEIIYEKIKFNKVSAVTWIGNALILGLGAVSIISQDGIWFKLQPALFEAFFASFLWGSLIMKKPFLLLMAEKQNPNVLDTARPMLKGMTLRLGFFFAIHAVIATWAAFEWTTAQWAFLKGAGLIISFLVYLGFEIVWARRAVKKTKGPPPAVPS